jgi:hypothetical protein
MEKLNDHRIRSDRKSLAKAISALGPGDVLLVTRLEAACTITTPWNSCQVRTVKRGEQTPLAWVSALIIVILGTILIWLIDGFVQDKLLASLLKALAILICLAVFLRLLLPTGF